MFNKKPERAKDSRLTRYRDKIFVMGTPVPFLHFDEYINISQEGSYELDGTKFCILDVEIEST